MVERFVINFAEKIPSSNHIAVFYNTPEDKLSILSSLIKGSLEKKHSIIYFSNTLNDEVSFRFHEAGVDLASAGRNDGLSISKCRGWHLEEGLIVEGQILDAWMNAMQNALARGFKGLCVICEPSNLFGLDLAGILRYEESLPKRFSSPLLLVCQYGIEELLSFEDGTLLLRIADAHSRVITPSFVGTIGFYNHYNQSLIHSLESIFGKTITSVFISYVKAKRRRCKGNMSESVEELDKYLEDFFGENASKIIKEHTIKEQYERIGLKFRSFR